MEMKEINEKIIVKPDIMGRKNYRNAAVFVPFIKKNQQIYLLLEKRANHIRQAGEISFPGGLIDLSRETGKQAAIRETCEELNLQAKEIRVWKQFHTLVTPHKTIVEVYLGEITNLEFPILFNQAEVEKIILVPWDFFWVYEPKKYDMNVTISSFEYDPNGQKKILFPATEIGVPKKYESTWNETKYPVYVYRFEKEIIWGMTAQIVYELTRCFQEI